jgi:hypothetical protein
MKKNIKTKKGIHKPHFISDLFHKITSYLQLIFTKPHVWNIQETHIAYLSRACIPTACIILRVVLHRMSKQRPKFCVRQWYCLVKLKQKFNLSQSHYQKNSYRMCPISSGSSWTAAGPYISSCSRLESLLISV